MVAGPDLARAGPERATRQVGRSPQTEMRAGRDGSGHGIRHHRSVSLRSRGAAGGADAAHHRRRHVEYALGDRGRAQAAELRRLDGATTIPRGSPGDAPSVSTTADGLRIAGTGWPGITKMITGDAGGAYLVRVNASGRATAICCISAPGSSRRCGRSAGASSAGMATPLAHDPWFPGDRAFIATAPRVQRARLLRGAGNRFRDGVGRYLSDSRAPPAHLDARR